MIIIGHAFMMWRRIFNSFHVQRQNDQNMTCISFRKNRPTFRRYPATTTIGRVNEKKT